MPKKAARLSQMNPLILLVDADNVFRGEVREALRNEGFDNVHEAINGLEALVCFNKLDPYMVVMAADMPIKDGISACELMRSLPGGERKSILMTLGEDDRRNLNLCYRAGATDFVTRPVSAKNLAKRVHFMLRSQTHMDELFRHEQRLQQAYRIARLGSWEWKIADDAFVATPEVCRMLQVSRKALKVLDDLIANVVEKDREKVSETLVRVLEDGIARKVEFQVNCNESGIRSFQQWVELECDERRNKSRLTGVLQDVTERKANAARIYNLSHYDDLTGLPNRSYLKQHLRFVLEQARREDSQAAVMVIDVDEFSRINNALGHNVGDMLLCSIADRLTGAIDDGVLLAGSVEETAGLHQEQLLLLRTDADVYTLVVSQLSSADKAGGIAERISQVLGAPFDVDGRELSMTSSIGISVYPLDAESDTELLECAELAAKHAKDQGRNNYQYFMQALNKQALRRLGLENDLRRAFDRQEFVLYYQPKVNLRTGQVDAVEALVRWNHPELGIVSPGEFVALAEDIGLIVQIGEWVLREACRQAVVWQEQGAQYRIAVNLSPRQFEDHTHLIDVVNQAVKSTGLPAEYLELELTESIFLKDTDVNRNTVATLKNLGVRIAIDDFGTGYSSLSYLTRFPVDTLKIDKSFISCVSGDEQQAEVVRTIITLARNLNMEVVAEGVAAHAEVQFLKGASCDYGQGYLFSPPLPVQRFDQWAEDFNPQLDQVS